MNWERSPFLEIISTKWSKFINKKIIEFGNDTLVQYMAHIFHIICIIYFFYYFAQWPKTDFSIQYWVRSSMEETFVAKSWYCVNKILLFLFPKGCRTNFIKIKYVWCMKKRWIDINYKMFELIDCLAIRTHL